MNARRIADSIAYCGLICALCSPDSSCDCKTSNHCQKQLSPEGCYQFNCCTEKGLRGCWECTEAPCGKDMLAPDHIRLRAFIRCIKENGLERFSEYIVSNRRRGIVYHRNGFQGDYDLETEEAILQLLRTGK